MLHGDAYDTQTDPVANGLDQDLYDKTVDAMHQVLVNLAVKTDQMRYVAPTQNGVAPVSNIGSSIQLPKLTIPKFDGNYLKWRQFHDLFSEMVDKQPIPSIQKMWYLKSNLSGEAEHLISQFSLSDSNYTAAWKTLQERYNNKRILVANLVDKILNQQSVTSSAQSIKDLHDTTKECLLALNNLNIDTSSWDAILIQILIKKLDRNTHIRYMQSLTKPKDLPSITEFLSFLELHFQSMEAISPREKTSQKAVSASISSNYNSTSRLCNGNNHKLYHCNKFLQLSEEERLRWVQRQHLCVNCFGSDHNSKYCNAGDCKKCAKKHNTLLHLEKKDNSQKNKRPSAQNSPQQNKDSNNQVTSATKSSSNVDAGRQGTSIVRTSTSNVVAVTSASNNVSTGHQGYVLLATAKVVMTASNGISEEFRAVLDSGSQVNIVSKRLCQRLFISPSGASLCLDGIGEIQRKAKYRINVELKSRNRQFSTNVEAYVLPSIIPPQPNQYIDISNWNIPANIDLADPHFDQQERIDVLLGAEFYYSLTQSGTIHLGNNLPTLQNTQLDWIVGGAVGKNLVSKPLEALTCAILEDTSLEEAIEHLWKLDEIEVKEKSLSPSEKYCESHFTHHVHTNPDGRFVVSLPFRENPTALGESKTMAYNRFMSLERRLLQKEDIRAQYIKFMQEYEQLGHMEKVDIDAVLDPKYFIPHHCVFKPDSTTTKLRVVFDASAKTSSGHSLNDLMYTGPTVQSELFSILLRFRLPKFDLNSLNNFKIPRHIFNGNLPANTQLHIFSDASEKAYGAVAYIRATLKEKRVVVQLLCAKTRVAPLKQQTLPRLELCAAVMAAQLGHRIAIDLQIRNLPTFFWTDSEIVLSWINAQSSLYHTFVANRVSKVQSLTLSKQWRHVDSKDNPADILSRGLPAKKFAECSLWFHGPLFLHGKEQIWPPEFAHRLIPNDKEKRKTTVITAASCSNDDFVYKIPHKNSFRTLQRTLAYMLRFIRNSRMKKEERPTYGSDILRVGGRLEASLLSYDAKHPMLIPYNDPIVKLLFIMIHEENSHCGPQALLNTIRQRFWPIKGKITARATVQKCVRCTKARPQLCQQIMGNLPQTRVTPARPFINAGVDYCGPLWIHYKIRGKRPTKAYIAVFCCFSTKAVHLELVSDLSTDSFIGALKRFIGRRGRCKNIYSDNATNFIGAKNQLTELDDSIYSSKAQSSIISASSSKGIHFHFIPPRAPHFGGLWEAAVKSAKHLLLRNVANASLTQDELETIIVEVEAILNSRPLTPITNDPNNLEALTPGHFLIGEPLTSQVDSRAQLPKASLLSHWKLVSHLKKEFWDRWSTEYLNELQQRSKWHRQFANIKVGDMVIIKEDNTPIIKWPLGRINQVNTGDDGVARVAEVKTASGTFKRPIHRLALLPIEQDPEVTIPTENYNGNIKSSNDEPKAKRIKIPTNHLTLALITILLLLPLACGFPVKNKRFGSKFGIHFEQIGTAAISTTEWNLFVYYDLAAYWSETSILVNGTRSIHIICKMLQHNTSCLNTIDHFEQMENELQLDNQLLRSKRGALDIVGNVAHSLFGILDSEYAEQMSDTIKQVNENESYLLKLLKNQTSIVDSTLNIIRQNQVTSKARFERLEQEIKMYSKEMHNINNVLLQLQLNQLFNSAVLELNLIANNIRKIQSSILSTLMDTRHGKISPWLLTPKQLEIEVNQIKIHSPQSLTLPLSEKSNLLQLFKLMRVKGTLTQQHAIFKITLPLVEHEKFSVLHLIPVPNLMNNTMAAIKPCTTFLGINTSRKQYIPFTNSKFSSCDTVEQGVFICSNIQIRYNFGANICMCEINLYYNKTTPTCILEKTDAKWIPLNKENQWIYASPQSSKATAVCNREIIPISLKGSGLLTLDSECILKHDSITMNGRQAISSTIRSSYTSLGKISELSLPKNITVSIHDNYSTSINLEKIYAKNMNELSNLQKTLKEENIIELPNKFKSHQLHNHAIGYLALFLSLVTLIIIAKTRRSKSRHQRPTVAIENAEETIELPPARQETNNSTPTPMPRQQVHKFMLDI